MTNRKNLRCKQCIEDKLSVFNVLTKRQKELLLEHHSCISYKKGEIIYREGDKPNGLLCLAEGKAKIFKEGVGSRDQIIRMAKPVGFIGYRALFADDNYTSSAEALEDCTVCVIEREIIFKVLRANADLAMSIIRFMARELGFANTRTVTLSQKHIRGRLAESLLFLREMYGTERNNKTLKVRLPREDLANLSNMTTSNAIRTLSQFSNEKVISVKGRKITILQLSQLEKISELG